MLGVAAAAAAASASQRVGGRASVASASTSVDRLVPCGAQRRGSGAMPASIERRARSRRPRTARRCRATARRARPARAAMALRRAVAEADHPFGRVAQMVGDLLHRLGGDGGERRVAERPAPARRAAMKAAKRNCRSMVRGEIAVRLLDQQHVAVFARRRADRRARPRRGPALELAGIGVERARLADQVERDIGEREVLLEHRRVAAPFRQPVAEHQRVVGQAQRM